MAAAKHPPIRWERVLPRRSLRVLLVENDDSTRHIVIALLRKCGYHVAAVADGVKAWEVLIEKEYNFDLVLAEVDMPTLSGIGLLSRILGDDGCKNIPVIMMSPYDSVSVVLKCMLKGAVDFLVKPVRKNELQNLWQHVWRKHCSSSYANGTDNNAASNHISANAGEGSETGENSDEGNNAHVGETPLYFQIPPNSNNEDAGFSASDQPREDACVGHSSTREDATFHPQLGYIAVPIPMGAVPYQTLCAGHHSILQPLFHCENSLSAHGSTAIGEHIGVPCVPVDQSNQTGSGSHDILHVSWSNCSGEASNAVVNRGNALESGNENDVQNCNRKGLGHDHSRRAAALIKFRLKRKARCFEKKVRYYSRQKLAEQRPRVKGQFVRQKSVGSSKATDTEE
ncbi:hypothetical protein J5N97_012115 [Dioscorea zingiberensis]|uniref:Uncharacterized protein n=1 Tax=Dioscorea zingiberensis TaxID=325984 RepID=A0A9D5CNE0_9LILI|nr:hypothetical protein J5N97_012115 [Dioscorea zingiberensis]